MKRRYRIFLCALALVLAMGVSMANLDMPRAAAEPAEYVPYSSIYSQDNPIPEISKNVRPAVVQVINIMQTWSAQSGANSTDQAYGSGVLIDERGYIVTNYHVVEDADLVEVETLDGARIRCTLQGYDDGTDLAVLKAEEPLNATPVPFGDSDALQIGELAIAIGNPGDSAGVLFGTVTAGIISALDREGVNADNFTRKVSVIQTDAAINTGNSGGALLNAKGELIGIPTLKIMYDYGTVYEGLGFAVPINTARPIIEQIIDKGKVVRPRLGVGVAAIEGPNEPLRDYPPAGVQILEVEPGSPAAKAGIMIYDVITHADGTRIKTYDQLIEIIDEHLVGDGVKLTVYRYMSLLDGSMLPNPETLELTVDLALLD